MKSCTVQYLSIFLYLGYSRMFDPGFLATVLSFNSVWKYFRAIALLKLVSTVKDLPTPSRALFPSWTKELARWVILMAGAFWFDAIHEC
jgi:hypothetical protein